MATIRLSGGGDYTSLGAAALGEAIGASLSFTEPGTYPNEAVAFKASQQVINASGGVVTVADLAARVTYMLALAAGVTINGITIAYGSNYARCASLGANSGVSLTDCILRATGAASTFFAIGNGAEGMALIRCTTERTGAGAAYLKYWGGVSSGTWTLDECNLISSGGSTGGIWYYPPLRVIMTQCRSTYKMWWPADPNSIFTAQDCLVLGAGAEPLASGYGGLVSASASIINCGVPTANGYLYAAPNASTLGLLTLINSYADRGTGKTGTGTWTAFAGGNNSHRITASAGMDDYLVGRVSDWRLGRDYTPALDSPLLERGRLVAGRVMDLYGNPVTGLRPCIGPVQPQYQARDTRTGRNLSRIGQARAA